METQTTENLLLQIEELQNRLAEADQMIEAIKAGKIDALALNTNNKPEVFTSQSDDYAYRVLVENCSEGAINLSEDGLILFANTAFNITLQLSYEKVIGQNISQFIHPDSQETFNQLFKKGLAGQSKGEINLMVGNKSCPVYVFLTSLYPTLPTVGVIVTNLTEKNQSIKELDTIKSLQNIFQHAPAAIAIYEGPEYKYSLANKRYEKLINRKAADLLGKNFQDVFPELKGTGIFEIFDNVFKTGEPFIAPEYAATVDIKNDGVLSQGYFNFSMEPLKNETGEVYAVVAMTYDITEQVELRKKSEESEALSRSTLESSPDCVKVIDTEGRLTYMNFNGLCSMEVDDFSQIKNKPWWSMWGKENEQTVRDAVAKSLAGKTSQFHALCPTAKGTFKWWDVMVSPIVTADGKISQLISVSRDITEHRRKEQQIQESEFLHRQIFNFSPVAIWEKDDEALYREIELLKGSGIKNFREYLDKNPSEIVRLVSLIKLKNVNDESVHLLEAESKEEIITGFQRLFTEESIPVLKEGIIGVAEGKKRLTVTSVLQSFKGKRLDILFGFEFKVGNTLKESLVTLTDITSQVKTQKKIEKSEEQLRMTLTAGKFGNFQIHFPDMHMITSKQCKADFGRAEDEAFTYEMFRNSVHPQDWSVVAAKLQKSLEKLTDYDAEYRCIWPDGSIHWISAKGKMLTDKEGMPVQFLGITSDITERKEAEKTLKESEERFRSLAQTLPQLVWVTDAQGNPEFASSRWKEYSGIEPGGEKEWKAMVHPADYDNITAAWVHSLTTGTNYTYDVRLKSKGGEYRWHNVKGEPVLDDQNNITKWVGAFTDIHEQKNIEQLLEIKITERTEELKQKNTELQNMNKELEAFNFISSHDLQEPLRKIQTLAGRILASENENFSETGKDYFRRMNNAAERMRILIQDLLSFSRVNNSERKFEMTNLNDIADEVKNEFKEALTEKRATIEVKKMCEGKIIPFQFRQLMHNLISNALKFTKPHTAPHITIKSEIVSVANSPFEGRRACHITVSDNGIGFEEHYSKKIFEVFQRLHGKQEYEGTGIGLAIVKKIVDNHNGIISAESELGEGATFNIYLPV